MTPSDVGLPHRDAPRPTPRLTPPLRSLLRRAVCDHIAWLEGQHRYRFPALLHLGLPGGATTVLDLSAFDTCVRPHPARGCDQALATDLVSAALTRVTPALSGRVAPLVWLTRSGAVEPFQDVDLAWGAAARHSFAEHGMPLVFAVMTRHGWRDPFTDLGQHWRRLRR